MIDGGLEGEAKRDWVGETAEGGAGMREGTSVTQLASAKCTDHGMLFDDTLSSTTGIRDEGGTI